MNGFQQFDVRGTDGPMTINAAGNFLRFDSTSGQPIKLRADGQDLGQLWPGESVELPEAAGAWIVTADAAETGIVRVGFGRIDSTRRTVIEKPPVLVMETDANPVPGGAGPGWVTGSPASMAASATVAVLFDLGADWDQYATVQVTLRPLGPSSGFSGVSFSGRDTPVAAQNLVRSLREVSSSAFAITFASVTTANAAAVAMLRPFGRYVVVMVTNADAANATGAGSRVALAAFPT